MTHERFDWDPVKASNNKVKHDGVSFEMAAVMLSDADAARHQIEAEDLQHSGREDRFMTIGSHPRMRSLLLVVVWAFNDSDAGAVTRIISARRATLRERRDYDQEITGK